MISAAASSFEGREAEVAELCDLAGTARVLTLVGPGGSGKTRLALRLLDELGASYGERCWAVGLADCHESDLVASTIATEIGMTTPEHDLDGAGVAQYLGAAPALLLLDNCEHLVDAVAGLVLRLIGSCPGVVICTTSRTPLALAAETTYSVEPMGLPGEGSVDGGEASALFRARARDVVPELELDPATVHGIVRAVDGIPLAVELAAARLRSIAPEVLLERLGEPLDVLGRGPRDAESRHRTVEASVDWSYQLSTPDQRALWRRLSVFAGGFDLRAAEAVRGEDLPLSAVLGLIGDLVDQSVLGRDPEHPNRYRMLEVIRHYGARRLEQEGETESARRGHLAWVRALAEEFSAEWFGPHQVRWIDRMRAEHPNVRSALEHAIETDPESALRIFVALDPFWITGHQGEARRWSTLIQQAGGGPAFLRARVIALEACGSEMRGQLDRADEACAAAAALLVNDPDAGAAGMLACARALIAAGQQVYPEALSAFAESAELFDRAGEPGPRARVRYLWAISLLGAGQPAASAELAAAVLAEAEASGDLQVSAHAHWVLGACAINDGSLDRAERHLQEALDRAGKIGDRLGTAFFLEFLAWCMSFQGRPERASGLVGAADAVWRSQGMLAGDVPQIARLVASGLFRHRAEAVASYPAEYGCGAAMIPAEAVAFALAAQEDVEPAEQSSPLTRRENEIAALVAEGLSNRGIADTLHLSERTVQGHVQSILRKLGFGSRVQIAAWVLRAGAPG